MSTAPTVPLHTSSCEGVCSEPRRHKHTAQYPKIDLTPRALSYAFSLCLFHLFCLDYKLFSKAEMLQNQSLENTALSFCHWMTDSLTGSGPYVRLTTYLSDWSNTAKFLYHEFTASFLLLNICGWHHGGGSHRKTLYLHRPAAGVQQTIRLWIQNTGEMKADFQRSLLHVSYWKSMGERSPGIWTGKTLEYYQAIMGQQHGTLLHVAFKDAQYALTCCSHLYWNLWSGGL